MRALSAWPRFNSRLPSCSAVPAESDCCAYTETTGANKSSATNERLMTFFVKLISLPFKGPTLECAKLLALSYVFQSGERSPRSKFIYESDPTLRRESNESRTPSSPTTAAGRPSPVQTRALSLPAHRKSALDRTVLSYLFSAAPAFLFGQPPKLRHSV